MLMIPSHHRVPAGRQGKSVREHINRSLYAIIGQQSGTSPPNRKREWENWPAMMDRE